MFPTIYPKLQLPSSYTYQPNKVKEHKWKITLESSNNHLVPIFIATKEKQSTQPYVDVFINTKVKRINKLRDN
jgi:hypothetical protein